MIETIDQVMATSDNRYLCFSLGPEEYGIPLVTVKEVIGVIDITPVPFVPPHFLGIMNLRGKVLTAIDLRKKLNVPNHESDTTKAAEERAIIICDLTPLTIGILVDSVNAVITPTEQEITAKPSIETSKNFDYVEKVFRTNERFILLLNLKKVLELQVI